MDDQARNPYSAPRATETPRAVALERIAFSGTVQRSLLRNALRARISWSGLATLGIVSLICLAANPDSLTLPWYPAGLPADADVVSEIVGVVGLGFLLLGIWHILVTCTRWGIDGRERAIRHYSPQIYDAPIQGYVDEACIYLDQHSGRAWLSWDAMGMCQFADEVSVIHWTKGVVGNTVLTQAMFASPGDYRRATDQLDARVNHPAHSEESQRRTYFAVDATDQLRADAEPVGVVEQQGDLNTVLWMAAWGIPLAITRSSRPLHIFFGVLICLALATTRQRVLVSATLLAVWAGILVVATLLTILQNREFFFSRTPPLGARHTFFRDALHLETAFAYFVIPLSQLQVVKRTGEQLTVQQQGYPMTLTYHASEFTSKEEFTRCVDLLEARGQNRNV